MELTAGFVFTGAVIALQSSHACLADAIFLYRNGRCASACILGTIAGEHLGQFHWLIRKWEGMAQHPGSAECGEFAEGLRRDHEMMFRDGLVSLQYNVPQSLAQLTQQLASLKPEDPGFADVANKLRLAYKKIWNRAPAKFYELRTTAQYVTPTEGCRSWSSPQDLSSDQVHDLLLNVGNCYRICFMFCLTDYPDVVRMAEQLGIKAELEDYKNTWPPPEADKFKA